MKGLYPPDRETKGSKLYSIERMVDASMGQSAALRNISERSLKQIKQKMHSIAIFMRD